MPWRVVRIKTFIAKIALSVSCQRRDDESLSFLLCALDKPISVRSTLNNRVTPWTKQSSYSLSRTMTGKLTRTLGARKKSHHQWWIQLSSPAILKMSGLVTEAFDMCTEFCREGSVVNPVLRSLTGNQCWETLHHFVMQPWTIAHQAPMSMEFSRQEYWSGIPCSLSYRGSSWPRDQTYVSCVSCIGKQVIYQ